jgi:hypothetical protein
MGNINKEIHDDELNRLYPEGYVRTYTGEVEKDFGRSGEYREIYINGHGIFNIFSFLKSGDHVQLIIKKLHQSEQDWKIVEGKDSKGNSYQPISIPEEV